jgi:hypothetical protein
LRHEDITEVSDPHQLTIDSAGDSAGDSSGHPALEIRVLKGQPTDAELAAVVTVLAAARSAGTEPVGASGGQAALPLLQLPDRVP